MLWVRKKRSIHDSWFKDEALPSYDYLKPSGLQKISVQITLAVVVLTIPLLLADRFGLLDLLPKWHSHNSTAIAERTVARVQKSQSRVSKTALKHQVRRDESAHPVSSPRLSPIERQAPEQTDDRTKDKLEPDQEP